MDQTEIGKFVAKCRKEKKLTQAQLAEKLGVTDRAVSKWETGKCMPDASIMLALCAILGITVNELLSGERVDVESYEKKADENLIALKRKDDNHRTRNRIAFLALSALFLTGMAVCLICDVAISGHLTWSLIPVSSIIFAWTVSFPSVIWGKKGIAVSLIFFSACIIPYLFVLSRLVKVNEVFSIGTAMAVVSIAFLWMVHAVFAHAGKTRRLAATGITLLLAIPFMLIVNIILSKMIAEPVWDGWDALCAFMLLISACALFMRGRRTKKDAACNEKL